MRILHLADLHLGWWPGFLGDRAQARQKERDGLLRRAVDYALSPGSGIGLVLIAGDLFETHQPEAALVDNVLGELRRLTTAGIHLVTLPGNHDEITYHDSVYRVNGRDWPGVLVQNPHPEPVAELAVQGEACHVYSLAYTGGLTRAAVPLASFPKKEAPGWHLGVFHGSLDWNAGDRSLPLASDGLARARYDYIALGHFHGHRQVQLSSGGLAVYPGSVEAKGFSDPGMGFFTVVTLQPGGVKVEKVPAGARVVRIESLDTGLAGSAEGLLASLEGLGGRDDVVRVVLTGVPDFDLDPETLARRVGPRFYHLEIQDQTSSLSHGLLEMRSREPTIRGMFTRRLRQQLLAAETEVERKIIARALRLGLASLDHGQEFRKASE